MNVIKLQHILNEITTQQKATSWLDPHGNFHFSQNVHQVSAIKIVNNPQIKDAMDELFKKGWQRVTYYSRGTLYANNPRVYPNDKQKQLLIDLTRELGFNKLVYDFDEDEITLWSSDDVL